MSDREGATLLSHDLAAALTCVETGAGEGGTPVVLLHGFAAGAVVWGDIQALLGGRSIAFDLPGHRSPVGDAAACLPKAAARAVLGECDRRCIARAHFVGHSMGGAIAVLIALAAPERVASLVLLAPGGFGPEIGAPLLDALVSAHSDDEALAAFAAMGADGWQPDRKARDRFLAARRAQDTATIAALHALLFRDGRQGVLPLDRLAATGVPVRLLWGDADRVTPVAPAAFEMMLLPGIGHMLIDEAPGAVVDVIRAACAG